EPVRIRTGYRFNFSKTINTRMVGRKWRGEQNCHFDSIVVHRAKRPRTPWRRNSSPLAPGNILMSGNERDGYFIFDFSSVSSEKPCVQKHENAYDYASQTR